ncbi:MAG: TonB family protein [Myxococcales bacterium]
MSAAATFGDLEAPRRQALSTSASLAVSVLLHLGLVAAILSTSLYRAPPLLGQQTIHVKLARIGTPRDKRLLPRRPQEPSSQAAAPVPVATSKVVPIASTHHVKLTDAKSKSPDDRLRNALAKLQQQVDQTGQADGFENGTDDVTEGDLYWARVVDRIKRFYVVPNTIPASERTKLVADVQITIGSDGSILEIHTQQTSGNATFDHAIETAVKRCRALPPPPAALADQARQGVVLEFRSAEM